MRSEDGRSVTPAGRTAADPAEQRPKKELPAEDEKPLILVWWRRRQTMKMQDGCVSEHGVSGGAKKEIEAEGRVVKISGTD